MNNSFSSFVDSSFCNKKKTFHAGKFEIILPEVFGFCGGVISALKKLENTVQQCKESSIYLLGEIIHNPTVNEYFIQKGVKIIPENNLTSIFNIANPTDIIILPAFGIPLEIEYKVRKHFHNIVDTTCKNVRSVWDFISDQSTKGATIILHGKPGHPEVKASVSRAEKHGSVITLPDISAAEKFISFINNDFHEKTLNKNESIQYGIHWIVNNFNNKKFALANQTTMLYDETKKIEGILSNAARTADAEFYSSNTICKATFLRQKAAEKLCSTKPDLIFVVGGYDSSNTNHLFTLASRNTKTIYIKDDKALTSANVNCYDVKNMSEYKVNTTDVFSNCKRIGLLAGASCPFSVINNLISKLGNI